MSHPRLAQLARPELVADSERLLALLLTLRVEVDTIILYHISAPPSLSLSTAPLGGVREPGGLGADLPSSQAGRL